MTENTQVNSVKPTDTVEAKAPKAKVPVKAEVKSAEELTLQAVHGRMYCPESQTYIETYPTKVKLTSWVKFQMGAGKIKEFK